MTFAHLVDIEEAVTIFKARYVLLEDVHIEYCVEGDIKIKRVPTMIFIPLMAVLKGGVRFPLNLLLLSTVRFSGIYPDQCLPNFNRVVGCISWLNRLYNLKLKCHDINFLYNCCGSVVNGYYLQVRDPWIRLISYLPSSNRNSHGEYIRVWGNWLSDQLTCPTSPDNASRYPPKILLCLFFYCFVVFICMCIFILFFFLLIFDFSCWPI